MRDYRDKGKLVLLLLFLICNIAHVSDRAQELATRAAGRRVAALEVASPPITGRDPAFGDRMRHIRQTLERTIGQADIYALGSMQCQYLGARPADRLITR